MRRFNRTLFVLALLLCTAQSLFYLSTRPVHGEFIRQAAITTGTARSLFGTLNSVGYGGPPALDEATICNVSGNAVNLYLGTEASVTAASGFALEPGACMSWHAAQRGIDSQQIFIGTTVQQNAAISVRQR